MKALSQEAQELRDSFIQGFIDPPPTRTHQREKFIRIRLGKQGCILSFSQIGTLQKAERILEWGVEMPEFHGLVNLRGDVVPVYRLATLLGQGPDPRDDGPRDSSDAGWLISVKTPQGELAFSFLELEGQLELDRQARISVQCATGTQQFAEKLILHEGQRLWVLDLQKITRHLQLQFNVEQSQGASS
jgi:chemotaxis signal transduction protein